MKHEEQEERVGENAQEQDRQNVMETGRNEAQGNRRRFLKTGAAVAGGGALAYSIPGIAVAQTGASLSPPPLCHDVGPPPVGGGSATVASPGGNVLHYEMTEEAARRVEKSDFFLSSVSALAAQPGNLKVRTDKKATVVFPRMNKWSHVYLVSQNDGTGDRLAGMLQIFPVSNNGARTRYDGLFFAFTVPGTITMTAPAHGIVVELEAGNGSAATIGADLLTCLDTALAQGNLLACYQRCLDCFEKHVGTSTPQSVIDACLKCIDNPGFLALNCLDCMAELASLELVGAQVAGCIIGCACFRWG